MSHLRQKDVADRAGARLPVFLIVVALIGVGTCAWLFFSPPAGELRRLRADVARLERENQEIWWGNVRMERRVRALHESPLMIEREARHQLGYGRPGEQTFEPAPAEAVKICGRPERRPRTLLARAGDAARANWADVVMGVLGLAALGLFMSGWRIEEPEAPAGEVNTGPS